MSHYSANREFDEERRRLEKAKESLVDPVEQSLHKQAAKIRKRIQKLRDAMGYADIQPPARFFDSLEDLENWVAAGSREEGCAL
jgi:hypothetical protein